MREQTNDRIIIMDNASRPIQTHGNIEHLSLIIFPEHKYSNSIKKEVLEDAICHKHRQMCNEYIYML
jgi:hypothetical protein